MPTDSTMIELLSSVWISERACIGEGVLFGRNIRIWGPTQIGARCIIEDNVQIGHPSPGEFSRAVEDSRQKGGFGSLAYIDPKLASPTIIGEDSIIRSGTVIYSGVVTGVRFDCAHNVNVREDCRCGNNCYLKVGTQLLRGVVVGHNARLGGTLCDRSKLGNNVSCFGHLMHAYRSGKGGDIEPAPVLEDLVVVGRGACVIGSVRLEEGCYVGGGAVVVSDVPPYALVLGPKSEILLTRSPVLALRQGNAVPPT